jgi:hypothetical protein
MAGATIINATVLHNTTYGPNVWMTAILWAVFVLLAYGRRQQIRSLVAAIRRVKTPAGGSAADHRHAQHDRHAGEDRAELASEQSL